MTETAITVQGLGKRYRIGRIVEQPATRAEAWQRRLLGPLDYLRMTLRPPGEDEILWALRDASFEVARGEVVGIIGKNGAGKSTLLKILTRITQPTEGRAVIRGRVGSMLEVGTGFHPELTGRENVYLNGTILGMKRYEIDRKFDEIVAFSGVDQFIDTPVKRYSSGMTVRLAFAVAAHLDPEVLLIDEVLAVGDAEFQKKSLGKMSDVTKGEGRTILFVSHNMIAMQSLCDRVIWLEGGRVRDIGPAKEMVMAYLADDSVAESERVWSAEDAPGDEQVRVRRLHVGPADPAQPLITYDTPITVTVEYENLRDVRFVEVVLQLKDEMTSPAFSSFSARAGNAWTPQLRPAGRFVATCHIPAQRFNIGRYSINVLMVTEESHVALSLPDALSFEVRETYERPGGWYGRSLGVMRPALRWHTQQLQAYEEAAFPVELHR